jgi:hypothetical protein
MANYVVSKLVENGIVGGGETVDFKRSNFVLHESILECVPGRMRWIVSKARKSIGLDEG